MIRHIVFFKFKPEASTEDRAGFVAMLRELPSKIATIQKPEVGEDILHTPRSFDVALNFGFPTREALQEYAVHPDHQPVLARGKEIVASSAAVDFEI